MSCNVLREVAHDYFLEHLSPEEVARIDEHVAGCAECKGFMEVCRELSCREFVEFLMDYIDDELPPDRRAVFERHLAICPDCTAYLASYRRVLDLGVAALSGQGPMPAGHVPEELVQAVLEARRQDEEEQLDR